MQQGLVLVIGSHAMTEIFMLNRYSEIMPWYSLVTYSHMAQGMSTVGIP